MPLDETSQINSWKELPKAPLIIGLIMLCADEWRVFDWIVENKIHGVFGMVLFPFCVLTPGLVVGLTLLNIRKLAIKEELSPIAERSIFRDLGAVLAFTYITGLLVINTFDK